MNYSYFEVGVIVSAFSFSNTFVRIPLSKMMKDANLQNVGLFGLLIISISTLSYIISANSFMLLLVIRMAHGIGFSLMIIALFTYVAKEIGEKTRYKFFINIGIVMMGSAAIIPMFTELLVRLFSDHMLYVTSFIFSILAFPFTRYLRFTRSLNADSSGVKVKKDVFNKPFVLLLISTWVFSHSQATILNFIGLLFDRVNLGMGGSYIFVCLVTAVISSVYLYKMDKIPHLGIGYILLSIGSLLLAIKAVSQLMLGISALLNGIAMAIGFGCLNQYASEFGSNEQKAGTMALFTFTYDLGFISGSIISGVISEFTDLSTLFELISLLCCFGFISASLFLRFRKRSIS